MPRISARWCWGYFSRQSFLHVQISLSSCKLVHAPCFFFKKVLTKPKSYFIINHVVNDAEIAQLVEHDLAKVGVASSSLVFRSM